MEQVDERAQGGRRRRVIEGLTEQAARWLTALYVCVRARVHFGSLPWTTGPSFPRSGAGSQAVDCPICVPVCFSFDCEKIANCPFCVSVCFTFDCQLAVLFQYQEQTFVCLCASALTAKKWLTAPFVCLCASVLTASWPFVSNIGSRQ